ncbi:brassinosteroid LRR receptor kinase BRL1-like isoform X2 [Prosopis cineraria]|uniref:brassinosteroid LRR receptor kinase BRL1-like isoform X2 n=1 Tax=Prosopis cineraria TaxID=364024 RepID=UPI0024104F32|nr:brassinosteroid LRR receptor kinase BRL1-like isoform X2 [Prosopis cineraria]
MAFATTFLACLCKKKRTSLLPPSGLPSTWSFRRDVQISVEEIEKATSNFSPDLIIGRGSFGVVYKARLSSGIVVAIKKLSPDSFQGVRKFQAEVETLDFGLARMSKSSHLSSQCAGSVGYMPPEYRNGMTVLNVKMDVYSFGVLMLETATGRRPELPVKLRGKKELELVVWAKKMVNENREIEMVNPKIMSEGGVSEASVKQYFEIACLCCKELQRDRPAMAKVVDLLDRVSCT